MYFLAAIMIFCMINDQQGSTSVLVFVEDLRMGNSDQSEYFWSEGQTGVLVDVDRRGHIFVGDTRDNRLLEYDKDGRFLRLLGGPGKGPGEYEGLYGLHVFDDGRMVGVQVNGTTSLFNYYDPGGNFVRGQHFEHPWSLADIHFSPSGDRRFVYLFEAQNHGATFMRTRHVLMDEHMTVVQQLSEGRIPVRDRSRYGDPAYWEEQVAGQFREHFRGRPLVAFLKDGDLLLANTNQYEISRQQGDLSGKRWSITHAYKPILFTSGEREAFLAELRDLLFRSLSQFRNVITESVIRRGLERAGMPLVKQPIYDLIAIDDGNFMVVHDYRIDRGEATAHLFSGAGKFRGRVILPKGLLWDFSEFRLFFKNGFAYAARRNDEGDTEVVRFRYIYR